jgi:hypothetical protein
MEFKIFTRGTYFYIIDENQKEFEGLKKDVRVRRLTSNSSEFYFDNINGWTDPKGGVDIANIVKEDGSPYSLAEFIEFKESETGNFNAGGVSPQETETNIVAIADGYSYTNESGEVVNITQKLDISDINNQKIETLVNGVKVFEFPLYTINNDVQIDNNASEWNFSDDQITIVETNGDTQVLNFPYRVTVLVNPDGSIAIRQNNITIGNVPAPAVDASATQIGLVNLQNQTLGAGVKTFTSDIIANGVNVGRGTGNIASNVIIGVGLLTNNTTGIQNVVIGVSSMQGNTTGSDNFALGSFTLRANTIGTRNVGIGNSTIRDSIEANRNVAIGNGTLQRNISGSNNTAIGDTAGTFDSLANPVTIAINSIYIGHNTKPLANNQSNQIVIGQNATGLGNNSAVLGDVSIALTRLNGRVGINTSNPIGALQVDSTTGAFVPPRLTSAQRDLLAAPLIGSVIFNTTTNTLQTLNSTGWVDNSGGSGGGSGLIFTRTQFSRTLTTAITVANNTFLNFFDNNLALRTSDKAPAGTDAIDTLNILPTGGIIVPWNGIRMHHTIRISFEIASGSAQEYRLELRRVADNSVIGAAAPVQRRTGFSGVLFDFETFTGGNTDAFVTGGFYIALFNQSGQSLQIAITTPINVYINTKYQTLR